MTPKEGIASPIIRFPAVEIDVQRELVRTGGVEIPLRHKTFEVLLFLIEHRDRVVSKSELFSEVWAGVAVTEDTLVQSIVEIRKAVGDDSRAPQFIRTIPRVGYQVIAPLLTDEVATPPPAKPRRPWILAAAVVVVIAGAAGLALVSRKPSPTPAPQPAAPARTTVAVAFFESRTTTPDLEWLREGLPTMITTALAREPRLALISREVMERSARTTAGSLALARRLGAQRLVTGRFERSGESIRVDAQLFDVAGGRLLGGSSIVSTRDSLLSDIDVLSSRLATLLGTPPAASRRADHLTGNLDAYESYVRGVAAADGLNNVEAVKHLERAIALDPDFAMAHARIGYVYAVTWIHPDQALPYFEKALARGHRLDARERLFVLGWQAIAQRDYARAIEHFRTIVARYPADTEGYVRLGRLLTGEERLTEAIDVLRRGLLVDPDAPELNNAIGLAESYLGRHAEAIAHLQRYVAVAPNEPNAYDSLGLSYQWAGEYERALAAYGEALRLNPRFEVAVIHRANTYWQMGRNREAIAEMHRFLELAPSGMDQARGYVDLHTIYRALKMKKESEDVVRRAAKFEPGYLIDDLLLAVDRNDPAEAARIFESMPTAERGGRGMRVTIRLWCLGRAEMARAMRDEKQAIEAAREALRHPPPLYHVDDMEDMLGDMLAAFGRHAEAAVEYRRVLAINPNRGRTRYKLARSLQALGRAADAKREYERFLEVWRGADGDAPEVIDARGRVAMLGVDIQPR